MSGKRDYFGHSSITIADGASFKVTAAYSTFSGATGYESDGISPTLVNHGTLEVVGNGRSEGIYGAEISVVNTGLIHVVAANGPATGIDIFNSTSLDNSGVIDVSTGVTPGYFSGTTIGASGAAVAMYAGDFANSGTIRIVDGGPELESVAVSWYYTATFNHVSWTNSGLIQGDAALLVNVASAGPSETFANSGTMIGRIDLGTGSDSLINTGSIQGAVVLGDGNDTYSGAAGHLTGAIDGGAGADSISGGVLSETITGGSSDDTLSGGGGDDVIDGGIGDDIISAAAGANHLDGGAGLNTVSYEGATNGAIVDLQLGAGFGDGTDTLLNFRLVTGSAFADTLSGSASGDTLSGGAGDDRLSGREGNDLLMGGEGTNYLRGDDGNDTVQGGSGFDDINGNKGDDVLDGGSGGDDWLVGGQGNDLITARAGGNILYGNLGNDTLQGGSGNDLIRGGQGDDVIVAGGGNDWLSGDRGSDTLTGGAGADIFHSFGDAGLDVVKDFNAGEGDRVQLDPGTHYTLSQSGADTVIDMGGPNQLVLQNTTLASLPDGWLFGA
jgi:Ca2+-binding RTX toxin-like protein